MRKGAWVGLAVTALALAPVVDTPAFAQAATVAAEPDTARLDAARRVIDLIMPPAGLQAMIDAMVQPMFANVRKGILESPQMTEVFDGDAQASAIFERYMDRAQKRSAEQMRDMIPDMITAMTRAYARRFSVEQLREISAFFATPTGQYYFEQSMLMMSDPDVAAWQQRAMTKPLESLPQDIEQLRRELASIKKVGDRK